jgi:glutamine amidotransferase
VTRILILDYGVGNLFSLSCALEKGGAEPVISDQIPSDDSFDGLILPGVGHFTPVSQKLRALRHAMDRVIAGGRPVLGICLGMQVLFNGSEEGAGEGLGLLPGAVVRLQPSVKVPHMGWNTLHLTRPNPLLEGVPERAWAYFVHSFYPQPDDESIVVARTEYGISFPVVVARDNIFGTQFHPEKSGVAGSTLLKNFLRLCRP